MHRATAIRLFDLGWVTSPGVPEILGGNRNLSGRRPGLVDFEKDWRRPHAFVGMGLRPKNPGDRSASAEDRATAKPAASERRPRGAKVRPAAPKRPETAREPVEVVEPVLEQPAAEEALAAVLAAPEREVARPRSGRDTPLPPVDQVSPEHVAYVRAILSKFGVSPASEYEDLVQEVLLHATRSAGSRLEPRALLFGITRHTVIRWMTRRETDRSIAQAQFDEVEAEGGVPSVEDLWRSAERANVVHDAIRELPDIFREVFIRCELEDMAMPEVARELRIPVNTGYTRLHLARERFAEVMRRNLLRRKLGKDDLAVPIAIAGLSLGDDTASKAPRPVKASPPVGRLGKFARLQVMSSQAILVVSAVAALWTGPIGSSKSAAPEATALPEPSRPPPDKTPAPMLSGTEKAPPVRATASLEDDIVSSKLPTEDGAGPLSARAGKSSIQGKSRSEGTWARQIVGLARKGRRAEALTQAAAYFRLYPKSTYAGLINDALGKP